MNLHRLTRPWKLAHCRKTTSCNGVSEVSSPKCLKIYWKQTLCFPSFCFIMGQKHRKFMTIWKLCKRSSKWDVACHCSFVRLEMAKVWKKKSLFKKKAHFIFLQWAILVCTFLLMMQLRIVLATCYQWANKTASIFFWNGAKNKFLSQCIWYLWKLKQHCPYEWSFIRHEKWQLQATTIQLKTKD